VVGRVRSSPLCGGLVMIVPYPFFFIGWTKSSVERLSEKGRRSLECSLTEHLNGAFRPVLASLYLPNPR
jgi:hypothetical protein